MQKVAMRERTDASRTGKSFAFSFLCHPPQAVSATSTAQEAEFYLTLGMLHSICLISLEIDSISLKKWTSGKIHVGSEFLRWDERESWRVKARFYTSRRALRKRT